MSSIWNTAENLILGPSVEASSNKVVTQVLDSGISSDNPVEAVEPSGTSASWLPGASQPTNQCLSPSPAPVSESAAQQSPAVSPLAKKQYSEGSSGSQRSTTDKVGGGVGGGGGGGRPRGGSSLPPVIAERIARHKAEEQLVYKRKLRFFKKIIKDLVYENAALCDQVTEVQQHVVILSEERKFLLKKLCQYQNTADHHSQLSAAPNLSGLPSVGGNANKGGFMVLGGGSVENWDTKKTPVKPATVKRKPGDGGSTSSAGGSSEKQTKSRKSGNGKPKRLCPPITLDSAGRPIFPITLGPLTIHSLGEIVSDRAAYHTDLRIYPVGFCSSRIYASLTDPLRSVLYTCKIVDGGPVPRFEVVCEDCEESIIEGQSPAECHNTIMQSVNNILGMDLLSIRPETRESEERGSRFFGLSHPSVQNVLQACPGARKCTNYKWVKFEVCRSEAEVESVFEAEKEASLCHEALLRNIRFARHHVSPS